MANGTMKARTIALWVVSAALFGLFAIMAGRPKVLNWQAPEGFHGYPNWFKLLIGLGETAGGVLLLVPRAAAYAAAFLCCIMVGAAATHLREGESLAVPVTVFVLLAIVAWARRPAQLRGAPERAEAPPAS